MLGRLLCFLLGHRAFVEFQFRGHADESYGIKQCGRCDAVCGFRFLIMQIEEET